MTNVGAQSKQWHKIKSIRHKDSRFHSFHSLLNIILAEQLGIGNSVPLSVRDIEWKRPFIEIEHRPSSTSDSAAPHKPTNTHLYPYNENINYSPEPKQKMSIRISHITMGFIRYRNSTTFTHLMHRYLCIVLSIAWIHMCVELITYHCS